MEKQERVMAICEEERSGSPLSFIEEVFEKRIEEVVTILGAGRNGRDGVYEAVLEIVEKALIKIAMRNSNNIKSSAADFLGINRNTLHNKIKKLNL